MIVENLEFLSQESSTNLPWSDAPHFQLLIYLF